MFIEYILIFKYLFFCFFISIALLSISFFLVFQNPNSEKLSVYECGFSPFGDSRNKFEIRFYIVAILFLIFDLEIIFLFPGIVILMKLNIIGFITMIIFLIILTVGFIYEGLKGALDGD